MPTSLTTTCTAAEVVAEAEDVIVVLDAAVKVPLLTDELVVLLTPGVLEVGAPADTDGDPEMVADPEKP